MDNDDPDFSHREMFLLYGGSSCDGRGESRFIKKTEIRQIAEDHLREIQNVPYCFGHVVWIGSNFVKEIHSLEELK